MARDPKLEVSAVNIRIPESHERDYVGLVRALADLRRGVRVYGDSYVAISFFDPDTGVGVFSKYTELDIDGAWFDLDDFDEAEPEQVEEVSIPENLRPNLSQFFFRLDSSLHVVVFSSYAESKALSARSVARYFREAFAWTDISQRYGRVEADVVQSYSAVSELLDLPNLKEIRFIIRRPNPDDIGKGLASIIEKRLNANNADEYEEVLRSKDSGDITPSQRARELGAVSAENGELRTKSLINGIMTERHTSESPLQESKKYKPGDFELAIFSGLADSILTKIRTARQALRGEG